MDYLRSEQLPRGGGFWSETWTIKRKIWSKRVPSWRNSKVYVPAGKSTGCGAETEKKACVARAQWTSGLVSWEWGVRERGLKDDSWVYWEAFGRIGKGVPSSGHPRLLTHVPDSTRGAWLDFNPTCLPARHPCAVCNMQNCTWRTWVEPLPACDTAGWKS